MSEERALNIYQRINAVMKEVEYVQKDSQISGGGGTYKAVTHDQVVSVARGALVKHGVMIYPEQLSSKLLQQRDPKNDIKMHHYSGDYAIHFVNVDNGEDRVTVTINAHANDNGDKAPGKCVTYATKTAILKVLCLETGENDESRAEVRKPVAKVQADHIRKLLDHDEERITAFCARQDIESVEALPKAEYDNAVALIKRVNKERQNGS